MADLWQQFHGLPKAIRDGVATPTAITAVDELEQQYPGVELAGFVMRVVIREFPLAELASKISTECSISAAASAEIVERLRQEVFTGVVADYLGLTTKIATPAAATTPIVSATPTLSQRPPVNLPVANVTPAAMPQSAVILPAIPQPVRPKPVTVSPPIPIRPPTISSPPPLAPVAPLVIPQTPFVPPPIVPQPQTPVGSTAPTTQYSDDDAVEIAKQASKLRTLTTVNPNQDLDSLAGQILIEQNLASSDELLQRRSISILKSRLKDVRTTEEVVEMLIRDPKVGGLGLDREIALTVAAAAERYAKTLKNRGMILTPEQPLPPPMPIVPSVIQQKPAPLPPLHREAPVTTAVPLENFTEAPRPSRPIVRPASMPIMAPLEQPPPLKIPPKTIPPVIQRPRGADRPTVADVVRPQMALGPAEELRSMTLIEFRRLGQGAGDAARRLLEKFQHLQRESFTVWAEAVVGWRQSSIYQLYIAMGRESLEKGQPISQIIADRGQAGQPYLSEHEFTVLSDLNRQLQL